MNQFDILFRALVDYRKNTRDDKDCAIQRSAIIAADNESDSIEIKRKRCKIETDWIEAIEHGLTYIEKAINEERQFIRSNGEIIPIEKVKRVSKDSVEHLARHSNLLTREPKEGADLIPDNLYTVERLSDFAVYENRFLYMMLCYLRDFISMRYERIVEVSNTYNGNMVMNKTVVESHRRLEYKVELNEEKKNDEYLKNNNAAQDEINRILTIYNAIVYFLGTPLMNEVSKSPMLKPPITRTNVLRMNQNFRQVMALYEFITAYDKEGFEIITETKTLSPFNGMLAEEMAETVELSSFLTYEHGLGIKDYFKQRYEKEEERRKEIERRKYAEKIKTVKRHLADGNITAEEYIVMLEKRISELETVEEELETVKASAEALARENKTLMQEVRRARSKATMLEQEVAILKKQYDEDIAELHHYYGTIIDLLIDDVDREIEEVYAKCESEVAQLSEEYTAEIERIYNERDQEIAELHANYAGGFERVYQEYAKTLKALQVAHEEEIEMLNEEHLEEIEDINASHNEEINNLNTEHQTYVDNLNTEHQTYVDNLNTEHKAFVDELNGKHTEEVGSLNGTIQSLKDENAQTINLKDGIIASERRKFKSELGQANEKIYLTERRVAELIDQCERNADLKTLADARLNALRSEHGLIKENEDFTNKQMAEELEHQYEVFRNFRKYQWQKTKKRILVEVFDEARAKEVARLEKKKAGKKKEDKD